MLKNYNTSKSLWLLAFAFYIFKKSRPKRTATPPASKDATWAEAHIASLDAVWAEAHGPKAAWWYKTCIWAEAHMQVLCFHTAANIILADLNF